MCDGNASSGLFAVLLTAERSRAGQLLVVGPGWLRAVLTVSCWAVGWQGAEVLLVMPPWMGVMWLPQQPRVGTDLPGQYDLFEGTVCVSLFKQPAGNGQVGKLRQS